MKISIKFKTVIIILILILFHTSSFSTNKADLKDVITVLKICAGINVNLLTENYDTNKNGKIDLSDAVLSLKEIVNQHQLPTWNVGLGDLGKTKDYDDTLVGMGDFISDFDTFLDQLPISLDWREKGAVNPARQQGDCGSCWAFTSIGVMEAKIMINSGVLYDLSEMQQVLCNTSMGGCGGGQSDALKFWENKGPILESCGKYDDTNQMSCLDLEKCTELKYNTYQYYTIETANINEVKSSLSADGPAYFRFDVYSDFMTFWKYAIFGEVYIQKEAERLGGHAVLIIGWDNNKEAWLCKNSWGVTGPNEDGTFYIAWSNHLKDLRFGMANIGLKGNLTLRSPNGDEEWCTENTNVLEWEAGISGDYVKIDLYKNGKQLMIINDNTNNTGSYSWDIPNYLLSDNDYKIRITDKANPSIYDESNSEFSIFDNCNLRVITPNGGETWHIGETQTITWNPGRTEPNVKIYLYKEAEDMMIRIESQIQNDGSYVWDIPNTLIEGNDYKIYIKLYTDSNVIDYSDNFFSIRKEDIPPTANADIDQNIEEGKILYLTGSGIDTDGYIVSYSWKQIAGIPVNINNANNAQSYFTAPQVDSAGAMLLFQLTVMDDDGLIDSDTCTVNILDSIIVNNDIILYGIGKSNGNFGNRAQADHTCSESTEKPTGYNTYKMFVAYSGDTPVDWLPNGRKITSKNGTKIAYDKDDLFDGSIQTSLQDANVISSAVSWWTGMHSNGTLYDYYNCRQWSSDMGPGQTGGTHVTDSPWISSGSTSCSDLKDRICVAY